MCQECLATSNTCSYALASGKKRTRNAPAASFKVTRTAQRKDQWEPSAVSAHSLSGDDQTVSTWGCANSPVRTSDKERLDVSFLSGTEFSLCPGKGTGRLHSPAQADSTPDVTPKIADGYAEHTAQPLEDNASQESSDFCLSSLLQVLEELAPMSAASITPSADCLFLCLETCISKSRQVLTCCNCDVLASNPMLLVTILSSLVSVVGKLVDLFLECQSPDTVPTLFQFGSYSVRDPHLRTRLLKNWIEMHAADVDGLITRLKANVSGQAEQILDDAKFRADKNRHALQNFKALMIEAV